MTEVSRVGVIGAGTMGSGIAQVCATAGLQVTLVDVGLEALQRGRAAIEASLARIDKKKQLPRPVAEILGHIRVTTDVADLATADAVIEAAFEEIGVKLDLFKRLDAACKPEALLLSNTSSIPITRLAAATKRPAQVAGMHFMNPAPVMVLVEVIRALQTSDATVEATMALARRLGKTPVQSKDVAGFIANRMLLPFLNEAFIALTEGLGTPEDIDTSARLGLGHPIGPLALADLIGLDVCLMVLEVLHREHGDPKFAAAPILRQYVAAGWLGRKTGRGFHTYA